MKDVSIIVPIYNVEKYIEKCIKSLQNQTYSNVIIYAIIDGSPDNSIDIVKKYAKKDKRIICIDKENGGYGSVLEYAIANIKTKYFIVCDPDDWLVNDCVEKLIEKAEKYNADMVVGNYYQYFSDQTCYEKKIYNEIKIDEGFYNEDFGEFSYIGVSPHSKLYKTSYRKWND